MTSINSPIIIQDILDTNLAGAKLLAYTRISDPADTVESRHAIVWSRDDGSEWGSHIVVYLDEKPWIAALNWGTYKAGLPTKDQALAELNTRAHTYENGGTR